MMNRYFLDFTISSILTNKTKNFFIMFMLALLIFIVSVLFFISSSIKYELNQALEVTPDIIVQKNIGKRQRDIKIDKLYKILDINGVTSITPRVWGYYKFDFANVNFSIIGLDKFDYDYNGELEKIAEKFDVDKKHTMIVGEGVYNILKKSYYKKYFNFVTPNGIKKYI